MRFHVPEIVLGSLLTVAVFGAGMTFRSSLPPPQEKVETSNSKEAKQESAKAAADERIADYTWWLAVLTGALVSVSGIQGYFLLRSDKTARIAAHAADLSARAAVALELPLIRAEPVGFTLGDGVENGKEFENFGLQCFEFTNRGRTKAFPIELHWGWIVSNRLPDTPEYKLSKPFELKTTINETDGAVGLYVREFDMRLHHGDIAQITDRNPATKTRLHLYCRLTYEDFMYVQRTIGFCWQYFDQFGGGRFIADATPAYNQRT